jgi:ElaB/YqjD/DUF883 family membrane-anchored ribosome-binding protein
MATKLEKDVESLKKDIEQLRLHLGSTLSSVGDASHDKVGETKQRLKAAMQGLEGMALDRLGRANDVIHERGERAIQASREVVVRRPITTMGVSFAAGLMTAFLLERHRQ